MPEPKEALKDDFGNTLQDIINKSDKTVLADNIMNWVKRTGHRPPSSVTSGDEALTVTERMRLEAFERRFMFWKGCIHLKPGLAAKHSVPIGDLELAYQHIASRPSASPEIKLDEDIIEKYFPEGSIGRQEFLLAYAEIISRFATEQTKP